jgi:uncharacterized membrane protein
MNILMAFGRNCLAIAMVAFGVQHLVYADFVTRLVPGLPAWIPWHPFWACLAGAALIAAGLAILLRWKARVVALWLGAAILLSVGLLYLPLLAANLRNGGLWTNVGKALTLAGGAFIAAGTLPGATAATPRSKRSAATVWLERFIPAGRYFLSFFLILCGVEHFIYTQFVVTLVPSWIPGALFWTDFAGGALIAGGLGIIIPRTARLAAALTGLMVFLWLLLLHIPRAVADLHNSNETTAVFEALAVSGIAFMLAASGRHKTLGEKSA